MSTQAQIDVTWWPSADTTTNRVERSGLLGETDVPSNHERVHSCHVK